MRHIGVTDVRFLDYRDSGMRGSPDNAHPRALMNTDDDTLADALVAIMHDVEPGIVLTFGADGIYGHPDHVKAHVTATRAFETYKSQTGKSPALYYNAVPKERIQTMAKRTVGPYVGMTAEELAQLGTPEEQITTVVDVSNHYDRKLAVIAAHRTQIGPGGPWSDLPPETVRSYLSVERFSLIDGPGGDPLAEFLSAPESEAIHGA
jgi:N-acetyl-1-D-myo-inositol-2-amino-2-deoxy-alpha-D-glucopyranoside deacetylase